MKNREKHNNNGENNKPPAPAQEHSCRSNNAKHKINQLNKKPTNRRIGLTMPERDA